MRFKYACSTNEPAPGRARRQEQRKTTQTLNHYPSGSQTPFVKHSIDMQCPSQRALPSFSVAGASNIDTLTPEQFVFALPHWAKCVFGLPIPKCGALFSDFLQSSWHPESYFKVFESSMASMSRTPIAHCLLGERLNAREEIVKTLQARLAMLDAFSDWVTFCEAERELDSSENETLQFIGVNMPSTSHFQASMIESPVVQRAPSALVRAGERWAEVIETLKSLEVLLIGNVADDNEILKGLDVESRSLLANAVSVIENGPREKFERCKQVLLAPELRMGETCFRLNGMVRMIVRFQILQPGDRLQFYIANEIKQRQYEMLGYQSPGQYGMR